MVDARAATDRLLRRERRPRVRQLAVSQGVACHTHVSSSLKHAICAETGLSESCKRCRQRLVDVQCPQQNGGVLAGTCSRRISCSMAVDGPVTREIRSAGVALRSGGGEGRDG